MKARGSEFKLGHPCKRDMCFYNPNVWGPEPDKPWGPETSKPSRTKTESSLGDSVSKSQVQNYRERHPTSSSSPCLGRYEFTSPHAFVPPHPPPPHHSLPDPSVSTSYILLFQVYATMLFFWSFIYSGKHKYILNMFFVLWNWFHSIGKPGRVEIKKSLV